MRKQKFISLVLAGFMAAGQFGWVSAAAADEASPTPTPTASVTATPAPTVSPTATPVATPAPATTQSATPAPTAAPTPTASVEPSASVAPAAVSPADPTSSVEPTAAATASPDPTATPVKKKSTDIGPDGCGGVVPNWVFDTVSRTWVAADKASFSCDMASGYYLSPKYFLDKRIGWYEIIPPAQAASNPSYMITAPNVIHTVLGDMVVGSKDYQVAKSLGLLDSGGGGILIPAGVSSINGTGAGSNNTVNNGTSTQSWFDLTNLVNVVNTLQSAAVSGNATASSNTTVGNVGTGAANIVANLINLLASAWSWSNGNLSFFMQNILAPLTGDIHLNPTVTDAGGGGGLGSSATINGTGAGSNNAVDVNNPNTLNVNAKNSGSITNNVTVNAASGDATASKNTVAGNVSTGNATAQINIINLINSFITSGSSFFGILNIFGSLNGDILFPQGFLNGLVPAGAAPAGTTATIAGTGANSNNQLGVNNSGSATISNTSANSVNNNILTTAASGAASADANTSTGGISTGAASTNQSLFNIANSSIFGDNAVLVMVNVLGHWVGKIMNLAPTGSSQSALLTGNATVGPAAGGTALGIANTGADSTNSAHINSPTTVNATQSSTGTITNNVTVNAQSGNATADKNTKVGDVSTGKAQADSSVANLFNTVLNVKHWFGVLIINVFGDWTGDVNHDSAAGGYSTDAGRGAAGAAPVTVAANGQPVVSSPSLATQLPAVGLLAAIKPSVGAAGTVSTSEPANVAPQGSGQVLTAAATQDNPTAAAAATQAKNMSFLFIISAIVMLLAGALLSIDKRLRR